MKKFLLLLGFIIWTSVSINAQPCADVTGTGDCDGDGISNADEGINCENQKIYLTDLTLNTSNYKSKCLLDARCGADAYSGSFSGYTYCDDWNGTGSVTATWTGLTPGLETYYTVNLTDAGHATNPNVQNGYFYSPAYNQHWYSGNNSSTFYYHTPYSYIPTGTTMTMSINFTTSGSGATGGDLGWSIYRVYQLDPNIVCGGTDTDADGVPDYLDLDTDNDGILDSVEKNVDTDGDGIPDYRDLDSDNDGLYDVHEVLGLDTDNDGMVDGDVNSDGVPLAANGGSGYSDLNSDSDILTNRIDIDSDNDGSIDGLEGYADVDGDSMPNFIDLDSDGDGCYDALEGGATFIPTDMVIAGPYGNNGLADSKETDDSYDAEINYISYYNVFALAAVSNGCDDTDEDGVIDIVDLDDDNDGVPDLVETSFEEDQDSDGDGIPNRIDYDSDNDGCSDALEAGVFPRTNLSSGTDIGNGNTALDNAVFLPAVTVGANGLADEVETSPESGVVSYISYYGKYATSNTYNVCTDTDGDGIGDLVDIDDDNDGILDAVESPNCFYTEEELQVIVSVTSELRKYSSYAIRNSYDGNVSTQASLTEGEWVGKSIFEITMAASIPISGIFVDIGSWYFSSNESSTFQLEGSNGGGWIPLSDPMANISVVDFTINNTLQPGIPFEKYRLVGVVGSAYYPSVKEFTIITGDFVASRYTKPTCSDDLDGDGKPNHLDLDSDGDGCYDTYEGSVTGSTNIGSYTDSLTIPMGQTTGVGNNGLADHVETVADSDEINYVETYNLVYTAGLNLCADSDNDGIGDIVDIDDDNDGILDVDESLECELPSVDKSLVSVTSGITWSASLSNAIDGSEADVIYSSTDGTSIQNRVYLSFDLGQPYELNAIELLAHSTGILNAGSTVRIEGSDNGSTWKDLSGVLTTGLTDAVLQGSGKAEYFGFASNTTAYRYYRIYGLTGSTIFYYLREANFLVATPEFCDTDIDSDGDGIPNRLDLDSDGDGCYDSYEAGVPGATNSGSYTDSLAIPMGQVTGVGLNGMADHLETTVDSDTVNYVSSYYYAVSDALNVCVDSDEDGIGDFVDIDDDNDGIPDAVESPNCFYTLEELNSIVSVSSELTQYSSYVIENSYDNDLATEAVLNPVNWVGKSIFELTLENSLPISGLKVKIGSWNFSSNASSTFRLEGNSGSGWIPLSAPRVNTNAVNFTINNTLQPGVAYDKYRLAGVAGSSYYPSVAEFILIIDGLTLSRYPKPTCTDDLDGDGIPNHLDLDSDNDGIYDIVEAGNASVIALDIDGNGILEDSEFTDTDNDGLSDDIENIISGNLTTDDGVTPTETTIGIADYINIDSDGDGCNDANEAYNNVNADSNGDGTYGGLLEVFNDLDPNNINGVDEWGRVNAAHYPGTNASVTDDNISVCVPDFRPELVLFNSIVTGETGNINFVVNIEELNNYSIENEVPVKFTITKDTRIQINWNASLVGAFNGNPFLQVDNTEWTYDGSNPFAHIWTYNGAGAYPAKGLKKIGINANYTVPATGIGTHSLNVIIPFSNVGGENNIDNNISTDVINFDNN